MNQPKTRIATAVSLALFVLTVPTYVAAQAAAAPATQAEIDAAKKAADAKKAEEAKKRSDSVQFIEQIIVTSGRREQAASSVPYNITAISQETLRDENITDAKKLIQQSVSISAPGNSARFTDSVTVRGLNVSRVDANNLEQFVRSTLAYYLDDTPLPFIGYRIKDISRVEQLLGPQGTLYGAGSLGGAIRYITNQPIIGKYEAKVNTGFYQTKNGGLSNDTDVVINMPLGETVALRISAAKLDEKGYTDRLSNPPWNVNNGSGTWATKPDASTNLYKRDDWQKVDGGRISVLWKVNSDFSVTFAHTEQDQLAHGTNGTTLLPLGIANTTTPAGALAVWNDNFYGPFCGPGNPGSTSVSTGGGNSSCVGQKYNNAYKTPFAVNDHTVLARYDEFSRRKFAMETLDLDFNLGFAKLHSNTSLFEDKRTGQADYTDKGHIFYYSICDVPDCDSGADISSGRSAYMTFDNVYRGISNETRLTSNGGGPLNWIAGFFTTKQQRNLKFSEWLPGLEAYNGFSRARQAAKGAALDEGYNEDLGSKYKETAIFGELGYKFTDKWQASVGARVFNYSDVGSAKVKDYTYDLVSVNRSNSVSDSGKAYYKFNTSYQITEDFLTYLTLSQGFRRGGTNGYKDYRTNTVTEAGRNYGPDSTNNIELGLKGFMLDRQLFIQTNVYQIDWKNPQTYRSQVVENGFPINGTTNGPDARTKGFEFAARYNLGQYFTVNYASANSRGEFVATKTHCLYAVTTTGCRTWRSGDLLGGAPLWKHNLGARFSNTLENGLYTWASLSGRYVGAIQSDRQDSPAPNPLLPLVPPPRSYPSYTMMNASAGIGMGAWDASLWIANLRDNRPEVSNQPIGITGARPIYAEPRTIGMNLSYVFK